METFGGHTKTVNSNLCGIILRGVKAGGKKTYSVSILWSCCYIPVRSWKQQHMTGHSPLDFTLSAWYTIWTTDSNEFATSLQ